MSHHLDGKRDGDAHYAQHWIELLYEAAPAEHSWPQHDEFHPRPQRVRLGDTARYAKNLGIDRNEQGANSVGATSQQQQQDIQQPSILVRNPDAANAAGRPTEARSASRVLNTSAAIAKARRLPLGTQHRRVHGERSQRRRARN